MNKEKLFFSPGPLPLKNENLDISFSHRSNEFKEVYKEVKNLVLEQIDVSDKYNLLFIQGSGTSSIECALSSILKKEDIILVLSNGNFGKNAVKIANCYSSNVIVCNSVIEAEKIILNSFNLKAFFAVQFETSNSTYNELENIIKICKTNNIVSVIDSVSSLGFYNVLDADIICSSSSKILWGLPSLGLLFYKKELCDKIIFSSNTFYLDMKRYIEYDINNVTPHTSLMPQFISLKNNICERVSKTQIERNCLYFAGVDTLGEKVCPVLSISTFNSEKEIYKLKKDWNIEVYSNIYMKNYYQISMFSYRDEEIYHNLSTYIKIIKNEI